MKLVHPAINMQIEFQPEVVSEVILENQNLFSGYLSELYGQIHGEEGRFVLSEDGTILKIGSCIDCVINPYALDVNAKKVLNKVYAAIKSEIQDTELYLKYEELLAALHQFAADVSEQMEVPLEYDVVGDAGALLKLLNFRIAADDTVQLAGRLADYFKVLVRYTEVRLVILVNMKSFIAQEDMEYLQEICAYLHLSMLLLESTEGYPLAGTVKYVIDKDGCEIYT